MALNANGIDPAIEKTIKAGNLRKSWHDRKAKILDELKKHDKSTVAHLQKVFTDGLGPEIDNFYKLIGSKKLDKGAIDKSHAKIISTINNYHKGVVDVGVPPPTLAWFTDVLKTMMKIVDEEWKFVLPFLR